MPEAAFALPAHWLTISSSLTGLGTQHILKNQWDSCIKTSYIVVSCNSWKAGLGADNCSELWYTLLVFTSLTLLLQLRQRFWVKKPDGEGGRFPLHAASNPPARRIHPPFYLDSGGLQPVIHCLSSDIFGQYDGVTGRNDTGRNAHSTCGRKESLEDLT